MEFRDVNWTGKPDVVDDEIFVIGPPSLLGWYLLDKKPIRRMTIQGGFLAYHQNPYPCKRLDKFLSISYCPTFNLNGDPKVALQLSDYRVPDKRYVCKNICHTVEYSKEIHSRLKPHNRASEFFKEASELLVDKGRTKKFHDPTAAVCHLHPGIAKWVHGKIVRNGGQWGTDTSIKQDKIIADIDYKKLWEYITEFK